VAARPLWAFTPAFRRLWQAGQQVLPDGVKLVPEFQPGSEQILLQLRRLEQAGATVLTLFDVGRLNAGQTWRYVDDVISKSGVNPLRGLGSLLRLPFIDISRLYHCPAGQKGVTAIALGSRYAASGNTAPACGELHHLAILAHAEELSVTAIIVTARAVTTLPPEEFLGGLPVGYTQG